MIASGGTEPWPNQRDRSRKLRVPQVLFVLGTAGYVLVPALKTHKRLAPFACFEVLIAEAPGAFGTFPARFMGTAGSRALHAYDTTSIAWAPSTGNCMSPGRSGQREMRLNLNRPNSARLNQKSASASSPRGRRIKRFAQFCRHYSRRQNCPRRTERGIPCPNPIRLETILS